MQKSEFEMRTLLDECVASGSIAVRDHLIQFIHDKPHAATLASITSAERSRLLVTIARGLEGISTDYNFIQADMLLTAYDIDSSLLTRLEVVTSGGFRPSDGRSYLSVNRSHSGGSHSSCQRRTGTGLVVSGTYNASLAVL